MSKSPEGGTHVPAAAAHASYEPPRLVELGTLADLTLGGIDGAESDGFGTSGDGGSIS